MKRLPAISLAIDRICLVRSFRSFVAFKIIHDNARLRINRRDMGKNRLHGGDVEIIAICEVHTLRRVFIL
jgi:hypothetical protein